MAFQIMVDLADGCPGGASDEVLVARAWSGDDAALGALLERYRPLVRARARSYFLAGADRDDVVQEGMIGLFKAIRDFDGARDCGFRAFAELCVTRQILSAVKGAARRKHGPLNRAVSLHAPAPGDDEAELIDLFPSEAADPCERVVCLEEAAELERRFADLLSELECEVLQRYLDGHSYAEIADSLQRHVKAIDNAVQRIKRKLDGPLRARDVEFAV